MTDAFQSADRSASGNEISGNGANISTRVIIAAAPLSGPVILKIVRNVLGITPRLRSIFNRNA